jgi:hypothetical protein
MRVILTESAKKRISQMQSQNEESLSAIVITTNTQPEGFSARFIEPNVIRNLKSKCLGELIPGISIYFFGIEPLAENATILLHLFILQPVTQLLQYAEQDSSQPKEPLYLFRVIVQSDNLFQSRHWPITKAC